MKIWFNFLIMSLILFQSNIPGNAAEKEYHLSNPVTVEAQILPNGFYRIDVKAKGRKTGEWVFQHSMLVITDEQNFPIVKTHIPGIRSKSLWISSHFEVRSKTSDRIELITTYYHPDLKESMDFRVNINNVIAKGKKKEGP